MKILLINQYAGNKGDRAVLFATCRMLRAIDPSLDITVSTSDPKLWDGYDYYCENSIDFVPYAWDFTTQITGRKFCCKLLEKVKKYTFTLHRESFLAFTHFFYAKFLINPAFYEAAKRSDLVISIGGHHFTTLLTRDLVSPVNYDAMSVLSMNKKLICFSQSFGPFLFRNPRNLKLTRKILSSCSMLYPREKQSKDELLRLGISTNKMSSTYETVLNLNNLFIKHTPPTKRAKQIGIAIYCTQHRNEQEQNLYIHTIAAFCNHTNSKGYTVCFFPMELKGSGPDDRPIIKDILNHISDKERSICIDNDLSTEEHIRRVAECQVFIGHKTHSTIFALASGTPLIAIAYHPKTIQFMEQFDVANYAIDEKRLSGAILIEKFQQIEKELDSIALNQYKKASQYSAQLLQAMTQCLQS